MSEIVILGAGTAGTTVANRLRRLYADEVRVGDVRITVVDSDPLHVYQPGLLFLPFGWYTPEQIVRPRARLLHPAVSLRATGAERVEAAADTVELSTGERLRYDVLIIATGARPAPERTEGLTAAGWHERMFDFYTMAGATLLRQALEEFRGGRLVVHLADAPIKWPPAPLEFAFLADWFFTQRRLRNRVTITLVTPLDAAFTNPIASARLSDLLVQKGIAVETKFETRRVDGARGVLTSRDDREVPFDLLVTVPTHLGAEFVMRSQGLGDDAGFVRTDLHTLRARVAPNIFAIGDATDLPVSKAGSVAHFEADVLTENVHRLLWGEPLEPAFDGHASQLVATGHDRALVLDSSYEQEPLPGAYPFPGVGPLRLLEETHINHLGKLGFQWVYWNLLLPGHDVPLLGNRLSMRGGRRPASRAAPSPAPSPPPHTREMTP